VAPLSNALEHAQARPPPAPRKRLLMLDLAPHSDTQVKVTWRNGIQARRPYFIHRRQLESTANDCRKVLEGLGKEFQNPARPDYGPSLARLARAGSAVHYLLFDGAVAEAESAMEMKEWLEANSADDIHITVNSDLAVQVPWSLVFDAPAPSADMNGEFPAGIEAYRAFWGFRYRVTTLCNSMPMWDLDSALKQAGFRMLLVLHESEYEAALNMMNDKERAYFARVVERPVGRAFSWDAARIKWRQIAENDSLVYILCHSDGETLRLDHGDEISVTLFSQQFSKKRGATRGATLCFFNGCFTARGSLDNSFHAASQIPGFCGFVGTEAPIPTRFAARFGLQFLFLLVERGMPVQAIVDHLRVAHWPLGLLYGCYAHPAFSLEPSGDATVDIGLTSDFASPPAEGEA
jgi:hypothetical protein